MDWLVCDQGFFLFVLGFKCLCRDSLSSKKWRRELKKTKMKQAGKRPLQSYNKLPQNVSRRS
jgi:hypothetical protein